MDTIVLKFGGSSVSDNIKLNIVADKIKEFYKENNVVVVVSAQGKTTDNLLREAHELSNVPNERELDTLLSSGEQISMSKLSILLNRLGYPAISLTGWQAGIYTSETNQSAVVESIDTTRIEKELAERKIVIIAGFQGINEKGDITTFGRGGSDTTAVAVAAALKADKCYIFSDVDGVYSTDPNKIQDAKKISELSYEEMQDISNEGAKVLHNRCVEIGKRFNIPIITKSTFNNRPGSVINDKIEDTKVKSIVKNDNIILVTAKQEVYTPRMINRIYRKLLDNNIFINNIINKSISSLDIQFTIKSAEFNKFENLITSEYPKLDCSYKNISKISIIGYGIMNDSDVITKTMQILDTKALEVLNKSKTNRGCSKFHEQLKINHIWIKGRIHMKNISKDKLKKYERSFNQNENKVITNTVTKNGFFKSCENYDDKYNRVITKLYCIL